MIDLRNIGHIYNNGLSNQCRALIDVNLNIKEGEYISIVGQSGSGKTTLLNVVSGLMKPTEGEVLFEGTDIYKLNIDGLAKHRNKSIGFIFQNYFLEPKFTAFENVAIPLLNNKITKEEILNSVSKALTEVGLYDKADKLVSMLSGGERQRVAIARAIVNNPKVIFADEPTGNLDTTNGEMIMSLLEKFWKQGKTIILVTHNEIQAKRAKKTIKIEDGKIVSVLGNE
ncbi:MAG: ABC transporter ATP-binding protein [Bacilli bacterium]|nr:ABC transporter ATP-binding protein [Bacilli bacterium]